MTIWDLARWGVTHWDMTHKKGRVPPDTAFFVRPIDAGRLRQGNYRTRELNLAERNSVTGSATMSHAPACSKTEPDARPSTRA